MLDKSQLDELRRCIPLSTLISRTVQLRRTGADWFGPCPFHDERTASFSVNNAKHFFHCFGCGAHGDVFEWFRLTEKMTFVQAIGRAQQEAGHYRIERTRLADDQRDEEKQAAARRIWSECLLIEGSPAETYLREVRRISIPLPSTLRFHPELPHSRRHALGLPAMVAAVTNAARQVVAIQRTFLLPDGMGKAPLDAPKRSLGPIGLGAVRLAPASETLGIAEGIETALSAMEIYRLPAWAALGSNLAGVTVPELVRHVVIFADRGPAGERAAEKARETFRQQKRRVSVCFPETGQDFNDVLTGKAL